ncbi:MAG TPA: Fic family protein, partial [Bacteroidia bacterium]|nr:Fic family protein [Bacteroidia bacterium]
GLKQIIALKRDCEEKRVYTLGKKIMSAKKLLDYLFKNPVIKVDSASSATGLSMVASYNLVDDFVRLGILKKFNVDKRNQVFIFNEYYEIFNK